MERQRTITWAMSLAWLAFAPPLARADWPASPLVNVSVCTATGDQTVRALIGDAQGGMIVIWSDTRTGGADIYAQRLSAAGVVQWASGGVPVCVNSGAQASPQAVPDGAGGAIIVWQDDRSGTNADVYAQRIDATGARMWNLGGVALCTAAADQLFPKAVPDGAGGAVVAWTDQRASGRNNIYAQRVGANGIPQWAEDGVGFTNTFVEQQTPAVCSDDSGGVIVTWHAPASVGVHAWVQRVDCSGLTRWGMDGIAIAGPRDQLDPKVAVDGSGGAIVAWADYRDGNGTNATTYAQRLNAAGVPQWAINGVALAAPSGDQQYQAVVCDGVGGAVVVWSDYSSTAIQAQRVNALGVRQWSPAGVPVCSASGERQRNRIQSDGSGGVLVPWSDYRVGGGDLYVQRVTASGVPAWTLDGVAVCTAPYVQVGALLIPHGSGGALVAWSDYRGGYQFKAYAQNLGADGTLGGGTLGVALAPSPAPLEVACAGPNPHRGALTVNCLLPNSGTVVVGLYDVLGRCLESQTIAGLGSGIHPITFMSAPGAQAPGLYLVRLAQAGQGAVTRLVLVR